MWYIQLMIGLWLQHRFFEHLVIQNLDYCGQQNVIILQSTWAYIIVFHGRSKDQNWRICLTAFDATGSWQQFVVFNECFALYIMSQLWQTSLSFKKAFWLSNVSLNTFKKSWHLYWSLMELVYKNNWGINKGDFWMLSVLTGINHLERDKERNVFFLIFC